MEILEDIPLKPTLKNICTRGTRAGAGCVGQYILREAHFPLDKIPFRKIGLFLSGKFYLPLKKISFSFRKKSLFVQRKLPFPLENIAISLEKNAFSLSKNAFSFNKNAFSFSQNCYFFQQKLPYPLAKNCSFLKNQPRTKKLSENIILWEVCKF